MSSAECNDVVYKNGETVGVYDMPKEEAEYLRKKLTKETGRLHDWHYVGGRVVMKALPEGFVYEDPEEDPEKDPEGYGGWA